MPARRNNEDDRDEEILRRKNSFLSAGFVTVAIVAAFMGGLIWQTVKGWLPSNGSGSTPPNIAALQQSDREQDVFMRRLRWDVNKLYQRLGVVIGQDGRPVGNGGP